MAPAVRAFTIQQAYPGAYQVTCWNEAHTSCGVATYYDPGCSPWPDPMLLSDNVAALEQSGRVNMTGNHYDHRSKQWLAS